MGGARLATNVLAMTGGYSSNPGKLAAQRRDEPAPKGDIGPPPAWFDGESAAVWIELVTTCHAGTLCAADRLYIEFAVGVVLQMRMAQKQRRFDASLAARYMAVLQKLGLTPADRSRVSVISKDDAADPFSEFG